MISDKVETSSATVTLMWAGTDEVIIDLAVRTLNAEGLVVGAVRVLARGETAAVDIPVQGAATGDLAALRGRLVTALADHDCDVAVQRGDAERRDRRLLVVDMDSTLIRQEVIDELARDYGVFEAVAAVTDRAMAGELPFEAALRERCRRLAGAPMALIEAVLGRIEPTTGAERLLRVVRRLGWHTAVVSGGFIQITAPFAARLGIDHVFANELEVRDGMLTGELVGPIVDRAGKAAALVGLTGHYGLSPGQTVAIGDGANDLDMLVKAGLGVAFHARPVVRAQADCSLDRPGLDAVLYLLGFDEDAIAALDV